MDNLIERTDRAVFADVSETTPQWLTSMLRPLDESTSVVIHEAVNIGEGVGLDAT